MRWTRTLYFHAGTYEFKATADDGVELYVDGVLIINQWHDHPVTTHTGYRSLSEGIHEIEICSITSALEVRYAKLTWARAVGLGVLQRLEGRVLPQHELQRRRGRLQGRCEHRFQLGH